MKKLKTFLQTHPKIVKLYILGYIIFAGCFVFPFRNDYFSFDFMQAYLVLTSYGIIGLALSGIYGEGQEKKVYIQTLGLTLIGMICRFLLEYGEVSNTMNFTVFNITTYILIIPILATTFYHFIVQFFSWKK